MARVILGAVALSFVLAGCGGDPEAPPDPTATTSGVSTTPSTPPTPSAPTLPEEATANTKAGAIAFVRHYVELINYAQRTGDVEALAAVEAVGCESCLAARQGVKEHYSAGGSIVGGDWRIRSTMAIRNASIAGWVVDLSVRYGAQTVSYGTSKPDEQNEAGRMVVSLQIQRTGDGWKVLEWTRG